MEMGSIFVLYIQPTIPTHTHYYLKLPGVYVGIVGWIYRTKIDPISILHTYPCFFTFWSSGHRYIFFHFTEMFFPLLVPGLFSLNSSFLVLKLGR